MSDDDPVISGITQRLMNIRRRRRSGWWRFVLSVLVFLVFAIAAIPLAIWLTWRYAPDAISTDAGNLRDLAHLEQMSDLPLACVLLPPVVVGSLVLGTLVFQILRALGGRHALYCGFSTVMISVCAMLVGLLLLLAEEYGLHACSEALVGDYFVLISVPLGVCVAIGALLGWRIAVLP